MPRKKTALLLTLFAFFAAAACQSSGRGLTVNDAGDVRNNLVQPQPTPQPTAEPITIAAVGDIMLGSTFPNESRMPPNDGADMLKEVTPILSAADIAFGNLEGPMLEGGVSAKCGTRANCFAFRVPTRYGKYLKEAGFRILNLANNHAGDFGDQGRASTRKVLDELGIKHSGSDKGEFASTILEVKGRRVGFISFAFNNISLNVNDLETARRVVADLKRRADIVVVSVHGGAEGSGVQHVPYRNEIFLGEPRGDLRAFAHTVIDAGADLMLGHGPHVLRGMEVYKNHLVVYSLGNFATYGWFQLAGATAESMILEVTVGADGRFIGGKIIPVHLEGRGIPVLDKTNSAITTVRNLSKTDFGATAPAIADDGTVSPNAQP
jgi:poly-gamma-glutamate capsule biosynthesis protein CapA/YwtB (metallophosphatase superfamily)